MRNAYHLFIFFFCALSFGQNLGLDRQLPANDRLRKGVLPNGMTYYIYHTENLKGLANYYFMQNGGSILENDDQSGLSHFLEHMAFNNTKNFPRKAIIDTLGTYGIRAGSQYLNAQTAYDDVYYYIRKLPVSESSVDLGLSILLDWSSNIDLDENEIDLERPVIIEENRGNDSPVSRVIYQTAGTKFGHSKYAQRFPGGSNTIIKNFKYQTLRDFYRDWYRPDLQAIVVIGDVDTDAVEEKIKVKFASVPARSNPRKYTYETIKDNKDLDFAIVVDKEMVTSNIKFNIRHAKPKADNTFAYLRNDLLGNLVIKALNNRMGVITEREGSPAKSMEFRLRDLTVRYVNFGVEITPKENLQEEAFALVMTELNRAIKFGFSENEIKSAIADIKNTYKNQMKFLKKNPGIPLSFKILKNFKENVPVTDIETEYQIASLLMNDFKPEELLEKIQEFYTKQNRNLIVSGVKGEKNLTRESAEKVIARAENYGDLQPYREEKVEEGNKSLIAAGSVFKKGDIVSELENPELGFTTFKLSNGTAVHYRYSDLEQGKVRFRATSEGGSSLMDPKYLPVLRTIEKTIENSGLVGLAGSGWSKFRSDRKINLKYKISGVGESISGSSPAAQLETLLQLVHLRFGQAELNRAAYAKEHEKLWTKLKRQSKSINSIKKDSITHAVYGRDNPYKRLLDARTVEWLSFDQVSKAYGERFGNPGDFTFYIVGDVPKADLVPLLEKYIAGLAATTGEREAAKELPVLQWVDRTIAKDIFLEMTKPLGDVRIKIKKQLRNVPKSGTYMKILGSILQERYFQLLREDLGGTYSVVASGYFLSDTSEGHLGVTFQCNPELTDVLIDSLYADLEKVKNGEISETELFNAVSGIIKGLKEQKPSNFRTLIDIERYVSGGGKRTTAGDLEAEARSITLEGLKDLSRKVLQDFDSYKIVFRPKQSKEVK